MRQRSIIKITIRKILCDINFTDTIPAVTNFWRKYGGKIWKPQSQRMKGHIKSRMKQL